MTLKETTSANQAALETVAIFKETFTTGIPFYLTRGMTKEHIDTLYVVARDLYSQEKYNEALSVFEAMAFYDYLDQRGWMGSAACFEILRRYNEAISSYSSAALLDGEDPLPAFYSVDCYLALKQVQNALGALDAVISLTSNKPQYAKLHNQAQQMKKALAA